MPLAAGAMNRRVQFHRRSPLPQAVNTLRGGFTDHGDVQWAAFRSNPAKDITIGGFGFVAETGTLTVRSSAFTQALTTSHVAEIDGQYWELLSILKNERGDGAVRFQVQEAPRLAMYRREFETVGEAVTVIAIPARNGVAGGGVKGVARAIVKGYQPDELTGGIVQGDRKILLSAEDLIGPAWPVPPMVGDQIVVRNRLMRINTVDDSTHRYAGALNAYELRASS